MADTTLFHRDTVWDVCTKLVTRHSGRPDVDLARLAKRFWLAKGKLFDALDPETGRVVVPFDPATQPGEELLTAAADRARDNYSGVFADLIVNHATPDDFARGAVQPESPMIGLSPSIKKGMKITRAVAVLARQAFPSWGNDEASAAANLVVNGKEVAAPGFVCVSANPLDVLMTSESCSYSSCHRLKGGEYRAANFQFLCDSQSVVAYFYSEERAYSACGGTLPYKTWRQMVFFDPENSSVAFARVYGNQVPESAHALVRKAAVHALWKLLGRDGDPAWVVHRKNYQDLFGRTDDDDGCDDDGCDDYHQLCYRDPFTKERGCCWVALKPKGRHPQVSLAAAVPCFACDGVMDCSGYLTCNDCRRNKVVCNRCGNKVPDSRIVHHHDATYCQSCFDESFFRCHLCSGTWENECANDCLHGPGDGTTVQCCDSCVENDNAVNCAQCGDLWRAADTVKTADDGPVCRSCVEASYRTCGCCHGVRHNTNFETDDDPFCVDCRHSGLVAACPGCSKDCVAADLKQVGGDGERVCLPCRIQKRLALRNAQAAGAPPEKAAAHNLVNLLLAAQAEAATANA